MSEKDSLRGIGLDTVGIKPKEVISFIPLEKSQGYNMLLNGEIFAQFTPWVRHKKIQNTFFYSEAPKTREELPTNVSWSKFSLDLEFHNATYDGRSFSLRPKEFRIFSYMVSRGGVISRRNDLELYVWGCVQPNPNTLNSLVKDIRKAFRERGIPDPIETIPRVGHRLSD